MALQLFAAIEPEGKDYITLIAGFILGYLASYIHGRWDRFISDRDAFQMRLARCYVVSHHSAEASWRDIRETMENVVIASYEFRFQGHWEAFAQASEITGKLGKIETAHAKDAKAAAAELTSVVPALIKSCYGFTPNIRALLPIGFRWTAPIVEEIVTTIRWC